MAGIEDLLNQLPLDQIAGQLGLDPEQARSATESGLGALMKGMAANAQDPGGAASLGKALTDHSQSEVGSLDAIDTADGQKIVNHIFGDNTDSVVSALGGTGGGSSIFAKLLPMLAPIVMGLLGKKLAGGQPSAAGATASGGGGLDDLLGGILGGGSGGGGLADVLGGMLGGGSGGSGAGGLDDLLGGMLGGGTR